MADDDARPATAHGPDDNAADASSPTVESSTLAHTDDGHADANADAGEAKSGQTQEGSSGNKEDEEEGDRDVREWEIPDDELPPLPTEDDDEDLSLVDPTTQIRHDEHSDEDASALLERDTRRKLMDVESSFLPEPEQESAIEKPAQGADDTYLFGGSPGHSKRKDVAAGKGKHQRNKKSIADIIRESVAAQTIKEEEKLRSPTSPESTREAHDTSEAQTGEEAQSRESPTTIPPSSPSAEAAQRGKARGMANKADVESVTDESSIMAEEDTPEKHGHERQISQSSTIRGDDTSISNDESISFADVTGTPRSEKDDAVSLLSSTSSRLLKRPSFLNRRQSSQRSSASSYTGRSVTSEASDSTIGADFALQSGGAMPREGNTSHPSLLNSRFPSYASITSTGESVNGDSSLSSLHRRELSRLEEERQSPPETPRPGTSGNSAPTDTVIAQHVQNIRVPETIAREYREKHAARSPNRMDSIGPLASFRESRKGNLTLKEQNSKIDKLTKENFDLKLKIHFLDQALQNRSDEGVKEMIGKNVQLQTDLANEKKESQSLRKKVKELEQKLKAQEENARSSKPQARPPSAQSDRTEKLADLEEEVIFLRETVQEHEVEIERLREEAMGKEIEKRKLADYVKVMSEERQRSAEDAGVEETIDMWKDLLQAETARREQADEDAEKLREEVRRLKETNAAMAGGTSHSVRNVYNINKRQQHVSYGGRSEAGSVAGADVANGERSDSAASTLVETLKHENAELRRDLSAQTSMLTSRNRERERLQQEIEDLKLNQRRHAGDLSAVRSIAGDSIFERSVSRAHNRAESRMSGNTRMTQLSDAERDDYERRHAALRDELASVKMINQDLERELNAHLDILQNVEAENKGLREDKELTMEDLNALQSERDEAVALVETMEEEAEDLRKEALAEIEALENELNQKIDDFEALQAEMKSISENVVRLEDELNASRRKEQQLEQQLEETEAELDRTTEKLRDTQNKNERLDVQLESSQNEIAFLREEQEADKIKIGELEAALSASQTSLQDERERIGEERRQREIVDSHEKAEVQKILDELNEEVNTFKEESKKLRKNLERKEQEASQWKERLETLETNLKEALGDLSGTRSSILKDVTKLTRDLEHTMSALDHCQQELSEKERILRARDALLETAGLESRKLTDLLEKERAGRRADRNHFEQMQRSQTSLTHTIQQNDNRVAQIESARKSERRKYDHLEQSLLNQLTERNNLLLSLWNRLSSLAGAEFIQRNSLIHDALPSLELISKNLPAYSKNMNHALKTIEGLISGFRTRIREVERNLVKDFQTIEHAMDMRTKRIDHLEKMVEQQTRERLEAEQQHYLGVDRNKTLSRSSSRSHTSTSKSSKTEELSKLKSENKLLKAELQMVRTVSPTMSRTSTTSPTKHKTKGSVDSVNSISGVIPAGMPNARSSPPKDIPRRDSSSRAGMGLSRHYSASAAETLSQHSTHSRAISRDALPGLAEAHLSHGAAGSASAQYPPAIPGGNIQPLAPSEQRWIHRLKELERRLKAEREARLLDRSGARKRLEEVNVERDELRMMLERERMLRRESVEVEGVRGDERLEDTPRGSLDTVERIM